MDGITKLTIGTVNGREVRTLAEKAGIQAKPILKWAGGKTQMLNDLLPKVPDSLRFPPRYCSIR